jgi:lysozyme
MGWEGLCTALYNDANGFPTIGYGHKLTTYELAQHAYADGITTGQAVTLFDEDVNAVDKQVEALEPGYWSQGQFDALVSFTFNMGIGKAKQLLSHGLAQVPNQLPLWIHAGGIVLPGLVTRRKAEIEWWNS